MTERFWKPTIFPKRSERFAIERMKRPEVAVKVFIRFVLAKAAITYGLELMMSLFRIVQGLMTTMLVLVGAVKMADRVVREMMGL